jgi:formiminotetrahydrofolate cyclodeaminase
MNVRINVSGLDDRIFADDLIHRGNEIDIKAKNAEEEIMAIIESTIDKAL